jgi:hypothetical protein
MSSFILTPSLVTRAESITTKPNGKFAGNSKNVITMPKFGLFRGAKIGLSKYVFGGFRKAQSDSQLGSPLDQL